MSPFQKIQEALRSDNTFGTTLLIILIDTCGTEALQWYPPSIRMELEDEFRVRIPEEVFDRLMSVIALQTTDRFYHDPLSFSTICQSLSGDSPLQGIIEMPDALEIAWGMTEALLLDPPDPESQDEVFSPQITALIREVCKDEGLVSPPDVLKIAGVTGKDMKGISDDWSEDPEMAQAILKSEFDKTEEITAIIQARIQALFGQLSELTLRNGTTETAIKQMFSNYTKSNSVLN